MSANEFHDSTDCSRAGRTPEINQSVPGTPDILAQLRARVDSMRTEAKWKRYQAADHGNGYTELYWFGRADSCLKVLRILDELGEANQQHSTRHDVE